MVGVAELTTELQDEEVNKKIFLFMFSSCLVYFILRCSLIAFVIYFITRMEAIVLKLIYIQPSSSVMSYISYMYTSTIKWFYTRK